MLDNGNHIAVHEGNTFDVIFVIFKKGTRTRWNVSSATSIVLEAQKELSKFRVTCDRGHVDADWSKGRIVATVKPDNVTAVPGTYRCVMTVTIGTEVVSLPHEDHFIIEVNNRPGYPYP